ncbi:MAG: toprim domain-containing protein [Austwickia sp.]|nr:toprim domain-containing protein [Actinomycetota bacterium]MCO5308895.1 toprim domain-containing protein [Austwickia sp.]
MTSTDTLTPDPVAGLSAFEAARWLGDAVRRVRGGLGIVEGPMDAIAVTLAGQGRYVGLAQLGTALTEEQADQLAQLGRHPIVATDNDLAGQMAAHRDFWLLAQHGMDPAVASFPDGADPADLLTNQGAHTLVQTLQAARTLSEVLLTKRLANLTGDDAITAAADVLAAGSPTRWDGGCQQVAAQLPAQLGQVRSALARAARAWSADPRAVVSEQLSQMTRMRARIAQAATTPEQWWLSLAENIDPRLTRQSDWPSLAAMLQQAHDAGLDVSRLTSELTSARPLNELPAQDLRYRLVVHLPLDRLRSDGAAPAGSSTGAEHERRSDTARSHRPDGPRR